MRSNRTDGRILIYSHDTMGLGHLRRCRTIAHSLVERFKHVSVLILSGSPIIGSFDFKARVDFVRVPGVIKLRSGEYTSLNLHLDVEQTLQLRGSIIKHTAEMFDPDLFIVDKEPMGLRGEVLERDPAARSALEVVLCSPGVHAIWIHRIAHALWRAGWQLAGANTTSANNSPNNAARVAVRQGARLSVATKYVQIARDHFAGKGVHRNLHIGSHSNSREILLIHVQDDPHRRQVDDRKGRILRTE